MAADNEISRLTRSSALSKAARKTWSSQPADEDGDEEGEQPRMKFLPPEGGNPSPQLRPSENESFSTQEVTAEKNQSDAMQARLRLSLDTSQTSVRSTDTTLEYFDAPLSVDHEGKDGRIDTDKDDDDVITINIKYLAEKEEPEEATEAATSPITEQTLALTSEDSEKEEDVMVDRTSEDVMEVDLEQEAKTEEEAQSRKEDGQDIESNSRLDAATVDQNESFTHCQGNLFVQFVFSHLTFASHQHCTTVKYKTLCCALITLQI